MIRLREQVWMNRMVNPPVPCDLFRDDWVYEYMGYVPPELRERYEGHTPVMFDGFTGYFFVTNRVLHREDPALPPLKDRHEIVEKIRAVQ